MLPSYQCRILILLSHIADLRFVYMDIFTLSIT